MRTSRRGCFLIYSTNKLSLIQDKGVGKTKRCSHIGESPFFIPMLFSRFSKKKKKKSGLAHLYIKATNFSKRSFPTCEYSSQLLLHLKTRTLSTSVFRLSLLAPDCALSCGTNGGAVPQSVERATPGEEVLGSIPAVAARFSIM